MKHNSILQNCIYWLIKSLKAFFSNSAAKKICINISDDEEEAEENNVDMGGDDDDNDGNGNKK